MVWTQPAWFLLTLVPFILFGLGVRSRVHANYADTALRPWAVFEPLRFRWVSSDGLRFLLNILIWLLLAAAMADPRIPQIVGASPAGQFTSNQDVAIMVILDVSSAMDESDIAPQRKQRAQLELQDLFSRIKGERVGLIVFSGSPHLLAPPTRDMDLLNWYLKYANEDFIRAPGSRIDLALEAAQQQLETREENHKAVLLLTAGSGMRSRGNLAIHAASKLKKSGTELYVLGLLAKDNAQTGMLEALADRAAGRYVTVRDGDQDWVALYDKGLARLSSNQSVEQTAQSGQAVFRWFLFAVIFLIFLPAMLSCRRVPIVAVCLLAVVSGAGLPDVARADLYEQAWNEWQQEHYAEAGSLFASAPGYQARMGQGASLYRQADYFQAADIFRQAILLANSDQARADSLYNMGNAYFQAQKYILSVDAFRGALAHAPQSKEIQSNLNLSRALLPAVGEDNPRQTNSRSRAGLWLEGRIDVDNVIVDFKFGELDDEVLARLKEEQNAFNAHVAAGNVSELEQVKPDTTNGSDAFLTSWNRAKAEKALDLLQHKPQALVRSVIKEEARTGAQSRLAQ